MELDNSDIEEEVQVTTLAPDMCPHGYCPELYQYFKEMFSAEELKRITTSSVIRTALATFLKYNHSGVIVMRFKVLGRTLEAMGTNYCTYLHEIYSKASKPRNSKSNFFIRTCMQIAIYRATSAV